MRLLQQRPLKKSSLQIDQTIKGMKISSFWAIICSKFIVNFQGFHSSIYTEFCQVALVEVVAIDEVK